MKTVYALYDEFKRSSWVFLAAGCSMFFAASSLYSMLMDAFYSVLNGDYLYEMYFENLSAAFYLPFVILLALSQHRSKGGDFRSSMPYTADELYFVRLLYGALAILAVTAAQWLVFGLMFNRYAFILEDLKALGEDMAAFVNPLHFALVLFGEYVGVSLVLQLVSNRFAAAFACFAIGLMPEMLTAPYQWIFGEFPDIEVFYRIKYAFIPGINDNMVKPEVFCACALAYGAIIAGLIFAGVYVNGKTNGSGRFKVFYNKGVKAVFIVLSILFALNVFDTFFIQGGL